jgi:OmcA/MtrC family decaheme c-type cytochrome
LSPYVAKDNATNYGAGFSVNAGSGAATAAAGTTLVISPIATVCFACHDSSLAMQHMESNGGSIYKPRSTALAKAEQCTLCHTSGKVADIRVMHAR